MRFSLSYRDVEELLADRGLHADHVTVWRWVRRYAPEMARRLRSSLNSTNDSWRVDETYIPSQGQVGVFVSRGGFHRSDHRLPAFQPGATPWPPSAFRAKALGQQNHPAPRVINTDKDTAYPPAIVGLKAEG